ncbi:MAG: FCD domain-containing protein [Gammaproteobacteria bacterium]|nr:FCD domain-containing protein [Gammaproteobacteria bacterium]
MTRTGIAELRHLAEQQYGETKRRAPGYLERIGNLNTQFHRLIYTAAGSLPLANIVDSLFGAPATSGAFEFYREEDLMRSLSHPHRDRACHRGARQQLVFGADACSHSRGTRRAASERSPVDCSPARRVLGSVGPR